MTRKRGRCQQQKQKTRLTNKKGTSNDAPSYCVTFPYGKRSVYCVFQRFTRTETRDFSGSDGDLFTCLRVATSTGSTLFHSKSTKTYQRNVISGLQRFCY